MQKLINLMNTARTTTSASYTYTEDRNPLFYWDADVYDNVTAVYLEAVMRAAAGDTAYMILSVVDPVGGSSNITGSEISTTSTTNVKVRSSDIKGNLTDNSDWLRARWKRTGAGTASFDSVRLIIVQQGAVTKTETVIELGEELNTTTSYVEPDNYAVFLYTSSRFNGTVNAYFEADLHNNGTTETTYAQLYDVTAAAAVSGSEVSHTGDASTTRKRSAAITLTDGHEYRAQVKGSATTCDVTGTKIIIQQTGTPTSTECYIPILNTVSSGKGASYVYQGRIADYSDADWVGDVQTDEYEATLKVTANTGYYNLYNDTDAGELAVVSTAATTYARVRDTSVTLPVDDTNTLNSGRKIDTAGTVSVARSFLIITVTWSVPAGGNTSNFFQFF